MAQKIKRLYRSRRDRIICGVCGGFGKYLGVDSNIIRLVWVLLSFAYGAGIILYILACLIVPLKPR